MDSGHDAIGGRVVRMLISLHPDLLTHAGHGLDQATEGSIRRAVSTAYYAMFHLLIAEAVEFEYPTGHDNSDDELNDFGRRVDHRPAYDACRWVLGSIPNQHCAHLFVTRPVVSKDARQFLQSFIRLQDWRIFADYNRLHGFPWPFASTAIAEATTAITQWQSVRTEAACRTLVACIAVNAKRTTSKPSPPATLWA